MSDPCATPKPAFDEAYPEGLRNRERRLLEGRRGTAELPWAPDRLVGVGLSGGGIRSGTFALGVFQGMAKKGLLRGIDFLSTVSGGGYFGSFFGRLLTRDYVKTPEDVEEILLRKKCPEVMGFLRENGRYLSPNGGGDSLLFGAVVLRNLVSIHVVLGLFVLAAFLGLQSLRVGVERFLAVRDLQALPSPTDATIWLSPLVWLPLVSFVLFAIPIGWAYWLVEPERKAMQRADPGGAADEVSAISPVAGVALVLVASIFLAILTWGRPIAVLWISLAAMALLAFTAWKLAQWKLPDQRSLEEGDRAEKMDQTLYRHRAVRNRLGIWVTGALVVTALLLALALVDSLGQSVYAVLKGDSTLGAWLAGIFSSLGVLAGFAQRIATFFSRGSKAGRPSLPVKLIATVAALLIVTLLLVTLNAGSHAIAWGGHRPHGAPAKLIEKKQDERVYDVAVRGSSAPLGMNLRIRSDGGEEQKVKSSGLSSQAADRDFWPALLGFAFALLLSILFGQTWPFVNRSSQLPLYSARLTRAYLGASNPRRWRGRSITQPVEGDDTDLARYWPPPADNGAPIHLINVTINETIDGQSQVQQQDRKGVGLALGPWGLSAGVRHHVILPLGDNTKMNPEGERIFEIYPESGFRVFDYPDGRFAGEALPLGTWLSISGAAFSTGTGMRTSLGLSLLAGFGNVRLGRWWDSGVVRRELPPRTAADGTKEKAAKRKISLWIEDTFARLFPVQTYMLDEFLARFPGTARRRWYLSDGGHFENMGGYELLRRRLRFIVIVDGEMDADSTFEGLANLVRKARIDFGAEVRFLTEEQLDEVVPDAVRPYMGTVEQLRRGTWEVPGGEEAKKKKGPHGRLVAADRTGLSLAHAALAQVTYSNPDTVSWLLYVKPTLTGREPIDLLEYHTSHPDFPHETTIDQFFDEAQWESYRRLGQYIADVLFDKVARLLPEDDRKPENTLLKDWGWRPDVEKEKEEGRLPKYS